MNIKEYDLIRFSRQLDVYSGVGIYFGFFKDEHYHLIYIKNRFRKLIEKNFYIVYEVNTTITDRVPFKKTNRHT
jgi:hypothetical protein